MDITNAGGGITVNGNRVHGYKLSLWISDYNIEHGTKLRPSTMTTELIQQFVTEVQKPYISRGT